MSANKGTISPVALGLISDPPTIVLTYDLIMSLGKRKRRKRKMPLRDFTDKTNVKRFAFHLRQRHNQYLAGVIDVTLEKMLRTIQEIQKGNSVEASLKIVEKEYSIDPDEDLNLLSPAQLAQRKAVMDEMFHKNLVRPEDPEFIYDKEVSFNAEAVKEGNEWDEEEEENAKEKEEGKEMDEEKGNEKLDDPPQPESDLEEVVVVSDKSNHTHKMKEEEGHGNKEEDIFIPSCDPVEAAGTAEKSENVKGELVDMDNEMISLDVDLEVDCEEEEEEEGFEEESKDMLLQPLFPEKSEPVFSEDKCKSEGGAREDIPLEKELESEKEKDEVAEVLDNGNHEMKKEEEHASEDAFFYASAPAKELKQESSKHELVDTGKLSFDFGLDSEDEEEKSGGGNKELLQPLFPEKSKADFWEGITKNESEKSKDILVEREIDSEREKGEGEKLVDEGNHGKMKEEEGQGNEDADAIFHSFAPVAATIKGANVKHNLVDNGISNTFDFQLNSEEEVDEFGEDNKELLQPLFPEKNEPNSEFCADMPKSEPHEDNPVEKEKVLEIDADEVKKLLDNEGNHEMKREEAGHAFSEDAFIYGWSIPVVGPSKEKSGKHELVDAEKISFDFEFDNDDDDEEEETGGNVENLLQPLFPQKSEPDFPEPDKCKSENETYDAMKLPLEREKDADEVIKQSNESSHDMKESKNEEKREQESEDDFLFSYDPVEAATKRESVTDASKVNEVMSFDLLDAECEEEEEEEESREESKELQKLLFSEKSEPEFCDDKLKSERGANVDILLERKEDEIEKQQSKEKSPEKEEKTLPEKEIDKPIEAKRKSGMNELLDEEVSLDLELDSDSEEDGSKELSLPLFPDKEVVEKCGNCKTGFSEDKDKSKSDNASRKNVLPEDIKVETDGSKGKSSEKEENSPLEKEMDKLAPQPVPEKKPEKGATVLQTATQKNQEDDDSTDSSDLNETLDSIEGGMDGDEDEEDFWT